MRLTAFELVLLLIVNLSPEVFFASVPAYYRDR